VTTVHHSAICVRDIDASLRFYRDGLGLQTLMDHGFDGDWPTLFDAPATRLRSVFLGDPDRPDIGIVELVAFDVAPPPAERAASGPLAPGFFLLSFFVDVDETLARIERLGLARDVRRIEVPGPVAPVAMATLRDPDGVLVELVGVSA
jgi:catechol 2,3-dioxygenase-like lactoylglutathione lyase family enzyme